MSDIIPPYTKIRAWISEYAAGGVEDRRALHTFMECETSEVVKSLQVELISITQGRYMLEKMDQIVGAKRRYRHGTYEDWARIMLLWMNAPRGS